MKNSRTTAERMRPILQAMERSIEAARQKRLQEADGPAQTRPLAVDRHTADNGEIPRQKARPKRATPQLQCLTHFVFLLNSLVVPVVTPPEATAVQPGPLSCITEHGIK